MKNAIARGLDRRESGGASGRWMVSAQARAGDRSAPRPAVDLAAAERGRVALTLEGFLKPEWSDKVYVGAARLWGRERRQIPRQDPAGYAAAFRHHYGLHPAPYPNDGLPMGLRRGRGPARDEDRHPARLHALPRRVDRRPELRRAGKYPARPQGRLVRADHRRRQTPALLHVRAQLVARDQQRRPDRCRALEPAQPRPFGPVVSLAVGRQSPRDGHTRRGGT